MAYSVMLLLEYKKITNNCENLIHVTCLAHGLNKVAESIRIQHPQINGLISNVKKVLLKSPLRVQIYKDKLPDVPLPPEPVITRWGTWLNAAIFLANHYELSQVQVVRERLE